MLYVGNTNKFKSHDCRSIATAVNISIIIIWVDKTTCKTNVTEQYVYGKTKNAYWPSNFVYNIPAFI